MVNSWGAKSVSSTQQCPISLPSIYTSYHSCTRMVKFSSKFSSPHLHQDFENFVNLMTTHIYFAVIFICVPAYLVRPGVFFYWQLGFPFLYVVCSYTHFSLHIFLWVVLFLLVCSTIYIPVLYYYMDWKYFLNLFFFVYFAATFEINWYSLKNWNAFSFYFQRWF